MARSVLYRVASDWKWVDTSGDPWLPEESPVRRVHANAAMIDQLHARGPLNSGRLARHSPGQNSEPSVLLGDPPISSIARGIYHALAAGGVATLLVWARYELGLPAVPVIDRLLLQPAARTLLINIDQALARVPTLAR